MDGSAQLTTVPGFGLPGVRWRGRGSRRALVAAGLALLATSGAAGFVAGLDGPEPAGEPGSEPQATARVVGLGWIEPASTVVTVGAPGNLFAARVDQLLVEEGDWVGAGQVLATLDTAHKLATQAASAEAQMRLKRLQLEREQVEIATEVAERRAALARARADLTVSETEFERTRVLLARGVATRATYDARLKDMVTARATIDESEAQLSRLGALSRVSDGGQIDIAVARQDLAAAEADVAVAHAALAEAIIRAPFAGRVLGIKAHAGERLDSNGLLELGSTDRMRAVIEVYESDICRVRVGGAVRLRAPALGLDVEGHVERLGAVVRRQTIVNNDPAATTDARVIAVYVALDAETSATLAHLSRLQVEGVFE